MYILKKGNDTFLLLFLVVVKTVFFLHNNTSYHDRKGNVECLSCSILLFCGELDTGDIVFNAAFVGSTSDFEVSIVTPLVIPGVLDEPVVLAAFGSVTNHFNGVSAQRSSGLVGVYTRFVGWEIGVNGERNCQGAIVYEFGHDVLYTSDGVSVCSFGLVVGVGLFVS